MSIGSEGIFFGGGRILSTFFVSGRFQKKKTMAQISSEKPRMKHPLPPGSCRLPPVTPIYKPFSPFGRGISLLRGLTITMVIGHLRPSWDDPPSTGTANVLSTFNPDSKEKNTSPGCGNPSSSSRLRH